ncbi:MAG: BrnT family toxin [Lacunisphaera sp.]
MRFAWDPNKERANVARHGVDFIMAQRAFSDPKALVLFDEAHSNKRELRWWLLGQVDARILLVRYTHRPNGIIRLIGAGYWREGRDYYENHWKSQTL